MKKRPASPKKNQAPCDEDILAQQQDLFFEFLPPISPFLGTDNPRHLRALTALERGPVMREELDRIAGCSNGPQLVGDLRELGLKIECERVRMIDRDGRPCCPGRFYLTEAARAQLRAWRKSDKQ